MIVLEKQILHPFNLFEVLNMGKITSYQINLIQNSAHLKSQQTTFGESIRQS